MRACVYRSAHSQLLLSSHLDYFSAQSDCILALALALALTRYVCTDRAGSCLVGPVHSCSNGEAAAGDGMRGQNAHSTGRSWDSSQKQRRADKGERSLVHVNKTNAF